MVSVTPYEKKPMSGRFFLRALKALVRVTLSYSFRVRPPSVPGLHPHPTQNPQICRSSDPMDRILDEFF